MAKVMTDNKHYTDIAAAIRAKNGLTLTYKPAEMAAAILGLATATENGGVSLPEAEDGTPGSTIIPNTPENTVNPSTPDVPATPYDPDKPEEMEVPKNIIEKVSGQSADTFDVMLLENGTGDITYGFLEKGMWDYNGHILPALPAYDTAKYPYAYLAEQGSSIFLFLTDDPVSIYYKDGEAAGMYSNDSSVATIAYKLSEWSNELNQMVDPYWLFYFESASNQFHHVHIPFWANVDMERYNNNDGVFEATGTVGLSASEPIAYNSFEITWYDPATTNFKAKGWRRLSYHRQGDYWQSDDFTTQESGGWNYLKNITECTREKLYWQGVEVWPNMSQTWSYNGVELPVLPKVDKKYRYMFIEYYKSGTGYTATLYVTDKPLGLYYYSASIGECLCPSGGTAWARMSCKLMDNGALVSTPVLGNAEENSSPSWVSKSDVLWANYDVPDYVNGGTILAASDPIPV